MPTPRSVGQKQEDYDLETSSKLDETLEEYLRWRHALQVYEGI